MILLFKFRIQEDTLELQQQQQQKQSSHPGMSSGAVIVGASLVALGATAATIAMFGNVTATSNNLAVCFLFIYLITSLFIYLIFIIY